LAVDVKGYICSKCGLRFFVLENRTPTNCPYCTGRKIKAQVEE